MTLCSLQQKFASRCLPVPGPASNGPQAKKTLIKDHLDHCLDAAAVPLPRRGRKSMAEFKEITKYL
jgi:hypothetical protein